MSFHVDLTTVNVPSTDATPDFFSWTLDGVKLQTFSSSKTWSIVRERQPICGWHKTVGFKGHIPKHALTMWVAVLDRLPTRNRLALWGMLTPVSCCLCSSSNESRDHIFVECDFTKDLWRRMLAKVFFLVKECSLSFQVQPPLSSPGLSCWLGVLRISARHKEL